MDGSLAGAHQLVTRAALLLISFYQRYVSPRKGFCCAHRVLHNGLSCSEAVKRIIQTNGIVGGAREIRHRFSACREAAATLQMMASEIDDSRDAEITRRIKNECACDRKNCGDLFSSSAACG